MKKDESINVIDGMVKAKILYKRLSIIAHPDKHPNYSAVAGDLMSKIVANRYNYSELLALEKEVKEKLNKLK
ncbi:hypothetical protein [uncultured Muribaculum sp.]|uniref:hypothetical protein n=1 Tax=uncultured Muribaculum sp. TaxID=1918613 RepID=UPI0027303003|nr:hypothetical protein [uncultured Muribaculum sp.]